MEAKTSPVLQPNTIYLSGDRFVCDSTRCAGSTAVHTGRDIDGNRLAPVTSADVREWASYDMGALRCECGTLTATEVGGPHGHAICRART